MGGGETVVVGTGVKVRSIWHFSSHSGVGVSDGEGVAEAAKVMVGEGVWLASSVDWHASKRVRATAI